MSTIPLVQLMKHFLLALASYLKPLPAPHTLSPNPSDLILTLIKFIMKLHLSAFDYAVFPMQTVVAIPFPLSA